MNLFTEIREGLGISWSAIRGNKLRSILTTLGIVIGIVTVTLMSAAIEGLNNAFLKSVSALGADVFYVQRDSWINATEADWLNAQKRRPITVKEAEALANELSLADAVAPCSDVSAPVQYKNQSANSVTIRGTTEAYLVTSGSEIAAGRFLSAADAAGGRPVCVLGAQVATNLFQSESPLGQKVKLGGQSFEVIGLLEKQGTILGFISPDNRVMIPLKQLITTFRRNPDIVIQVKARALVELDEAREELRSAMHRVRHLNKTRSWRCSIGKRLRSP